MNPGRPGGGRNRKITSGGGNANKRGGGLGGGPVGGGGRTGIAVLAAILIGKAASGGGSGSGGSKSGCLKRILIIAVIVIVVLFLVRMCRSGGTVSDLLDGGVGSLLGESGGGDGDLGAADEAAAGGSYDVSTLLGGGLNGVYSGSGSGDAYRAHEPDYTVAAAAREKYTAVKGGGEDSFTIMVFLCGTDLESSNGMGTADLKEMLNATLSDKVNLIVETGGASSWKNSTVSSRTNERYQVKTGGLVRLEDNLGRRSMVEPDTLTDFIRYCTGNFPADRYGLIFWDHGGGSVAGYGYDELFASAGSMSLDEIDEALKNAGCRFDFIGFDACLMATLETALVAEQYADYLIASEATEPGTGWYYTNWLTKLSENSSMPTVDLAKIIIDDFVSTSAQNAPNSPATLSLIDLAELSGTVPESLRAFSEETSALLDTDYASVSNARSGAKDFSSGSKINQIDFIHFADNLGTESARTLAAALRSCVKYNRCGAGVTNANGVTVYFPYQSLSKVSTALSTFDKIGMDESYLNCIRSFASMAAGGQVVSGGSSDALGSLLGADASAYSSSGADVGALLELFLSGERSLVTGDADSGWVDEERLRSSADYFAGMRAGFDALALSERDGGRVLALSEEQWAQVQTLEMNLFIDDGEGYIDMGLDPYAEYDEEGNLIMAFDGRWLSFNGQNAAVYFISEDRVDEDYTILYRSPALLNGRRVNLIFSITGRYYGEAEEVCTMLGAQADYQAASDAVMKGLIPIEPGDEVQLLCDYYGYDGGYLDSYYLGEPLIAGEDWDIGYATVGGAAWSMCYRITDIYSARYWTPAVTD
ncbi:MAG: clostripain-related cysteine peptidase [Clostridia bacterium]|nr:clostripain-related cysteine peptidase [Clostridia bacterium]